MPGKNFELLADEDAPAGDVIVPALGHRIVRPGDVVEFPDEFVDVLLDQPKTWKPSGWTPPAKDETPVADLDLAEGQPAPPLGVSDPIVPAADAFVVPPAAGDPPPPPPAKKDDAPPPPPASTAAETTGQASA